MPSTSAGATAHHDANHRRRDIPVCAGRKPRRLVDLFT